MLKKLNQHKASRDWNFLLEQNMLHMLMFEISLPKRVRYKRISHIFHLAILLAREISLKEVNNSCVVFKNIDCVASARVFSSLPSQDCGYISAWCVLWYICCLIYLQWRCRCCCYIRAGALDWGLPLLPEFRCKPVKTRQNAGWQANSTHFSTQLLSQLNSAHFSKHITRFSFSD